MKILSVIGIDMETDIGSWTPFYEGLVNGTPLLLDCFRKHNIKGTFYFTGDSAQAHPEVLKMVDKENHEIGCHTLHHETIGEPLFKIPGVYPLLPSEVEPRIKAATEAVENILDKKIVSFRCPRLFGGTEVVKALEKLGYVSDATYPMYFFQKHLNPYNPSESDWTKDGDLKLVEIPCFADLSIESKDPHGRDRDQWPKFRTESANALMNHVNSFINYCADRNYDTITLCFYFHPWEFWPMQEGPIHYGEGAVLPDPFIIKNCGEYALKQFDIFISMMKNISAEFMTANELAELFKSEPELFQKQMIE